MIANEMVAIALRICTGVGGRPAQTVCLETDVSYPALKRGRESTARDLPGGQPGGVSWLEPNWASITCFAGRALAQARKT
jgi:hypothetical protein